MSDKETTKETAKEAAKEAAKVKRPITTKERRERLRERHGAPSKKGK